ncbi:hypothetical protein EDB85DRAFT_394507 [Lactarius pseudohatsudake]|nr:hypothetical protein EDB85DRAFT_394507 [Lactarius pseudohatsudake]
MEDSRRSAMIQSNVAAFRFLRCCDKHVSRAHNSQWQHDRGRTRILDFRACSLLPVFGMGGPTVEVLSLRRVFGALMTASVQSIIYLDVMYCFVVVTVYP